MSLSIRRAGTGDIAAVAGLHIASWRVAYVDILDPAYLAGPIEADRTAVWTERLAAPRDDLTVLLAETRDGSPVGFVCVIHAEDPPWGRLVDNLHARPDLRGTGIGARLLAAAAAIICHGDMHLWVYAANDGARRFYARQGGREVDIQASDKVGSAGKPLWRVHWPDARRQALADATPMTISPLPG